MTYNLYIFVLKNSYAIVTPIVVDYCEGNENNKSRML